jgi:acyl carrier protein
MANAAATLLQLSATGTEGAAMDVTDEVKRVIAKNLKIPAQDLSDETKLQDLGAESLDFIEIVFELEEKFQIDLTITMGKPEAASKEQGKTELSDFATVGDICRAVKTIVDAKASK